MSRRTTAIRFTSSVVALAAFAAACGDDNGSGGSVEAWCDLMDEANEGDAIFEGIAAASPAEVEEGMNRIEEILPMVSSAAPDEIKDDVDFFVDYTEQLVSALEDANYSLIDVDLSFIGDDQQRLDEVNANIDAFSERECGQPFGSADDDADTGDTGDTGDDGDFDPAAGTIREQLVQQFVAIGLTPDEANCLADNADFSDEAVLAGDEAAVLALFEACNIPLERLAELGG